IMRIRFPVSEQMFTATVRMPRNPAPARRLHVLIIDDDVILLQSLQNTLEGEGHRVTPAEGGQAGIDTFHAALARREPSDVVITDLGMPYAAGRKVVENLRATSPAPPIILLTGWGARQLAEDDRPLAVDKLLSKPPRLRELREALADCCQQD